MYMYYSHSLNAVVLLCLSVCMYVQGVAWHDLFTGIYYPALSLYKGATVSLTAKHYYCYSTLSLLL